MSNPKPDFSTVIKTIFNQLQNIHETLVIAVNATQTKAESHSSQTLVSFIF